MIRSERSKHRPQQSSASLRDETLDLGAMKMGAGKAFIMNSDSGESDKIPVAKQWLLLEGRRILVEEVTIPAAAIQLDTLPVPKQASLGRTKKPVLRTVSIKRQLPKHKLAKNTSTNRMQMANISVPVKGFVPLMSEPRLVS